MRANGAGARVVIPELSLANSRSRLRDQGGIPTTRLAHFRGGQAELPTPNLTPRIEGRHPDRQAPGDRR